VAEWPAMASLARKGSVDCHFMRQDDPKLPESNDYIFSTLLGPDARNRVDGDCNFRNQADTQFDLHSSSSQ